MEYVIIIIGLFGLGTIYLFLRWLIFRGRVEFFKIMKSCPIYPENKMKTYIITESQPGISIPVTKFSPEYIKWISDNEEKLNNFFLGIYDYNYKFQNDYINNIKRIIDNTSSEIFVEFTKLPNKEVEYKFKNSRRIVYDELNYKVLYDVMIEKPYENFYINKNLGKYLGF